MSGVKVWLEYCRKQCSQRELKAFGQETEDIDTYMNTWTHRYTDRYVHVYIDVYMHG